MLVGQLKWTFVAFFAISALGTLGYKLIEGWGWLDSAWMVMITLTTIGFGEVHPLSALGKVFTIGLVTVGLGLVTVTFTQVTSYLVEGRLPRGAPRPEAYTNHAEPQRSRHRRGFGPARTRSHRGADGATDTGRRHREPDPTPPTPKSRSETSSPPSCSSATVATTIFSSRRASVMPGR